MNVASLDHCRKLHEASGWTDTEFTYYINGGQYSGEVYHRSMVFDKDGNLPAYDLGYLVRKLRGELLVLDDSEMGLFFRSMLTLATLEDAAAKLAIELFKQGVLKRDGDA